MRGVWTIDARYLNVRDLLKYDRVLVSRDAISVIENLWKLPEERREPSIWKQARLERRAESVGAGSREA